MKIYPLDFGAKDSHVIIYAISEDGRVILKDPFLNYIHVLYKEEPLTITDDRIDHIDVGTREFFGKTYKTATVFMRDANNSRELASFFKQKKEVFEVLEADVPYIRKYLVDKRIEPLKAYDATVDGDFIKSLTPLNESIAFDKLNVVGFDIETYATSKQIDSKKNPVLMIALYAKDKKHVLTWSNHKSPHDYVSQFKNEEEMLIRFNELLRELQPDIICGYSSDLFDWPYVFDRCEKYKISLNFAPDGRGIHFGTGQQRAVYINGIPHIDIYNFIRTNLRTQLETTSYSLDAVSSEILGEKKIPVDITKLYSAWDKKKSSELDTFIEYNLHDACLCYKLLEKIFPNIVEFLKMIRQPIQDLTRMSYSQLVEWYLIARSREFGVSVPNRPSREEVDRRLNEPKNEGAFVFKPNPGLYKNVVVFDFRSLYPSLIASMNIDRSVMNISGKMTPENRVPEYNGELYFAKDPVAFIPTVIADIIARRTQVTALAKQATNEQEKLLLEARRYNLKILANSMYGYLSFAQARWYCYECGGATTAYARHFIKYTIKFAQDKGFTVIYSDTDSIFLELGKKTVDDAKKFVVDLNKTLPGIVELQFEDEFASGLFVSSKGGTGGAKKRYALLSKKGKFKIVGFEYVRNDWCDYARETQLEVLNIVLKENNPKKAFDFIKKQVQALYKREVPVEQLIIRDKLSRDVSEYESNLPHVVIARKMIEKGEHVGKGKTISYIVANGKGNIHERVKLPSECTTEDYDTDYYINNQLIPVVSSIMEVFKYKKEDFAAATSQNSLSEFFN